jgi:hypothetical protein
MGMAKYLLSRHGNWHEPDIYLWICVLSGIFH